MVVVKLRSLLIHGEPPSSRSNSGTADIDSNGHVTEEEPSADQGLLGVPWGLVHDVQIWGVESEGSGGQSISDQVDPQQLDGDQSLGHAQSSGQEDTDDLADVGGDQVTDELLHVVVDSTALLNSSHDGGEIVIGQDHLRGGFSHSGTGAHSNTNLSLLQSRGVVHTITSLGRRVQSDRF